MKLVTFDDPIFPTIQGEGILLGVPSAFVRFYGCDFKCDWCDTKGSWKEGTEGKEWPLEEVVDAVRGFHLRHAVITGGNPLLQPNELADLCVALRTPWVDTSVGEKRRGDRAGMHITVETQASVYVEGLLQHVDLMSLSPKLHDWREDVVLEWVDETLRRPDKQVQLKVVSWDRDSTVLALDHMVELFAYMLRKWSVELNRLHFILQPEYSTGRRGVEVVRSTLEGWLRDSSPGTSIPLVRLIPQVHKSSLFVK